MVQSTPAPQFGFTAPNAASPQVSVVLPMYDEAENAASLIREVAEAMAGADFEIIAVDDCSKDDTQQVLVGLRADITQLRVLAHAKNAGQSRAVRTGILAARAPIVATLDGDGQNPPGEIPKLVSQLKRADAPALLAMVAGERQKRQDSRAKLWASRAANDIRKRILKDGANDTGCGLKVFHREAFLRLPYFDHIHRYLPALMVREGFEIEFAPVAHRPRAHGTSKYTNFGRAAVAVRDLFGVSWLLARSRRPERIEEL